MAKPKNFDHYKKLIDTIPELECKGATTGYTAVNGNMFTFLSKEGELGIRLSDEDFKEFAKKYNTGQFIQYGAKMRGYVKVPEDLMKDTKTLKPYLKKSFAYAKTLPKK